MTPNEPLTRRTRMAAPKAAAIAGIVFSVLFIASLIIALIAVPAKLDSAAQMTAFTTHRQMLILGLNLVPFAGIAFLWFMGVVRDRLGTREDQFFATVFLGSGLLFIAMMFTSAAVTGSLLTITANVTDPQMAANYYAISRALSGELMASYGIRVAGVFMISTCTLFLRTGVLPRWLAFLGYGFAFVMLFRIGHIDRLGWVVMFLPLWILLISVYFLIDNYRPKRSVDRS